MVCHQIIHMASVRNGLMSASRAVTVLLTVRIAGMVWCTCGGILAVHFQLMVVHVGAVRPMQMAVVQVVHVSVVFDCGMAAIGAVYVRMPFMNLVICRHLCTPYLIWRSMCVATA